jgi:diguanylate cyclase (GGDEF)-like protein/PAS domain S-box-containing protein
MNFLNKISIREKLIAITMISSIFSLVISGSAMILHNWNASRDASINRLNVLSSVIGDRSKAALAFNDDVLIQENLQSLAFEPSVYFACIYTASGQLTGEYLKSEKQKDRCHKNPEPTPTDSNLYSYDHDDNIFVHHDISIDNETLGEITIYSDSAILKQTVIRNSTIIIIIILTGISISYFLIIRLHKYISGPIHRLSKVAKNISEKHDFTIRAEKESNDETGLLVDTFNEMIATIHQQNDGLKEARDNYLALYDKNPMMLFTLDHNGLIHSVNEFVADHLGKDTSDLVGKNINTLVFDEDITIAQELITKCRMSPDSVQRCDLRINDINGKILWIRVTTRGITNADGSHGILFVCEDITEAHALTEQLSHQASHDALTGLVNRREFEHRVSHALEKSTTMGQEHALFFIDLDQFKVINDTCGHLAGDHLLRELVAILNPLIRQCDTLARLGGDEFGVLLENCALSKASNVADLFLKKINDFQFQWENASFTVGASIGVVPVTQHTSSITILMTDADAACYIAKDQGRNRIHIYSPGDEEIASHHGEMNWVNKIQEALKNDRFTLLAQTIVPLNKNEQTDLLHYEILVRMLDENNSLIPPDEFLGIAERYNLSPAIDRWVVRNTFYWLHLNKNELDNLEICAINLSGNTLGDETFSDYLLQQFKIYDIPSHKICFEITETAAIANLETAQRFIHSFRDNLNCKFSLDDFGSGLSSFAYLRTMPVDFLKIDGLFVRDIAKDPINLAMIRSINEIGKIMGKKTIAEFVENKKILKQLELIGIDYAQGYYISKPVALSEILKPDLSSKLGD